MKSSRIVALLLVIFCGGSAHAVTIPTVPVGNPGNAADSTGFGSVAYDYRIGTTEVTNAQYVEFLNAKAASDPLALYNLNMGSDARGGISRTGVSGSFSYELRPFMGDKPVNFVSWYDAIRFANWLNNGQGNGDTETGAYTVLGGTPTPTNGAIISRNSGATWFLPSEDEWYKAAYHQPASQGGDADDYWLFPTTSNTAPSRPVVTGTGDIYLPGPDVANYGTTSDWNGQDGNVTTVGSAGPLSNSFYGTADQAGNVEEWNEALVTPIRRGTRGGSWLTGSSQLKSTLRSSQDPTMERAWIGFRVATVPEPSTYALAAIGMISLLAFRRR